MLISDWSSDVCSSDLPVALLALEIGVGAAQRSLERLAQPDLTVGYRGNGVGAGDEDVGQPLVAMHVETEIDAAPLHAIADEEHFRAALRRRRLPFPVQVGAGGIGPQLTAPAAVGVHVGNGI